MEHFSSENSTAEEKLSPEERDSRRKEKRKKELKEKKKKREKEKKEKEKIENREKARVAGVRKGKESYARRVLEEKNLFKKSFRIGYMVGSWIAKRSTARLDTSTLAHPNVHEDETDFTNKTAAFAQELNKDELLDRTIKAEEVAPAANEMQKKEQVAPAFQERDFVMEEIDRELRDLGSEDHNIQTMDPAEALNLVRVKELEKELKGEQKKEQRITPDELSRELGILRKLWGQALDSMEDTSSDVRIVELLTLTARAKSNPKLLEEYLKNEGKMLSSEERFFIEMSIELNSFKTKAKELLRKDRQGDTQSLSPEEFHTFVNENTVDENVLDRLAQKIASGGQMTPEEIALFQGRHSDIEKRLREIKEK